MRRRLRPHFLVFLAFSALHARLAGASWRDLAHYRRATRCEASVCRHLRFPILAAGVKPQAAIPRKSDARRGRAGTWLRLLLANAGTEQ